MMCILKHTSNSMMLEHTPHISFCKRSATVSARTRQRMASRWTTVMLMTTSSSNQPQPPMNTGSSTTHSLPTPASSLHVLALPSCYAAMLDSVPVVQRLWQQRTATVLYAVVLSQWCCMSSISLRDWLLELILNQGSFPEGAHGNGIPKVILSVERHSQECNSLLVISYCLAFWPTPIPKMAFKPALGELYKKHCTALHQILPI